MKAKNVLIFGCSGQIGRSIVRKLTKDNYTVTAVTRNISLHPKILIIGPANKGPDAAPIDTAVVIIPNPFPFWSLGKTPTIIAKTTDCPIVLPIAIIILPKIKCSRDVDV